MLIIISRQHNALRHDKKLNRSGGGMRRTKNERENKKNEQINEKPSWNRAAYKQNHHAGEQEHPISIYGINKTDKQKHLANSLLNCDAL